MDPRASPRGAPPADARAAGSTIAAIASPPGRGARGLVRLSGPRTADLLARCTRLDRPLERRGLYRGAFLDGRGEQPLGLSWMPGPRSYTGEDVAELHLPGSPFLVAAALERLLALGAQAAGPGEFTRRAFENGRIDLARAEGVLDLVAAETEAQRRAAAELLLGGLGQRADDLRQALEEARALCEASLDFDESDTGHVPSAQIARRIEEARRVWSDLVEREARRAPSAAAARVVLCGAPNAGKSALFNRLCGAPRALESDLAGSTRDALRATWRVGDLDCELVDTAGSEDADDPGNAGAGKAPPGDPGGLGDLGGERAARLELERELARRARERSLEEARGADLVLWVVDRGEVDRAGLERFAAALPPGPARLVVWSKCDLGAAPAYEPASLGAAAAVATSAAAGSGLEELEGAVARALRGDREAGSALGPRGAFAERAWECSGADPRRALGERHRAALAALGQGLDAALRLLVDAAPLDLCAQALRGACDELDAVCGRTTPEDLLERIFARFCIGK